MCRACFWASPLSLMRARIRQLDDCPGCIYAAVTACAAHRRLDSPAPISLTASRFDGAGCVLAATNTLLAGETGARLAAAQSASRRTPRRILRKRRAQRGMRHNERRDSNMSKQVLVDALK